MAFRKHLLGELRIIYPLNGNYGQIGYALYRGGVGNKPPDRVARVADNNGSGRIIARTDTDIIHIAGAFDLFYDLLRLVEVDPALDEFIGTDPETNDKILAAFRPDPFDDLPGEAHPVIEITPVLILPLVAEFGEKLTYQVPVRAVDLDPVHSGLLDIYCALHIRIDHLPDILTLHLLGNLPVQGTRDGGGGDNVHPVEARMGLAPAMPQLNHPLAIVLMQGSG